MLKSLFIFYFAFNAFLASAGAYPSSDEDCNDDAASTSLEIPTNCPEGIDQLLQEGNAAITGTYMFESFKSAPEQNLVMSAFSTLVPFAQLALYAQGDTLDQFLKALNLPDKFNIRCAFPKLLSNLRAEENVVLNVASRIFATDEYPLSQNFLDDTKQIFDAEAESVNFFDGAAERINEWVAAETNNRIKDIAKPNMFDDFTRLVLANAIYFLGNWVTKFDEKLTYNNTFHISNDETVEIPYMFQVNNFNYGESDKLDCKVLEMFYKGGNFSFVVILPNKIDGLYSLIETLQDSKTFYEAYDSTSNQKVEVHLPKIKIESDFSFSPLMSAVGIKDVLDRFKSNLTGILKEYEPLYVSVARQKAFIEVDEDGTEAAAANVVVVAVPVSSQIFPTLPIFQADHPFAFYILNKRNIIFSGAFVRN